MKDVEERETTCCDVRFFSSFCSALLGRVYINAKRQVESILDRVVGHQRINLVDIVVCTKEEEKKKPSMSRAMNVFREKRVMYAISFRPALYSLYCYIIR
jgi:hypothetical protein